MPDDRRLGLGLPAGLTQNVPGRRAGAIGIDGAGDEAAKSTPAVHRRFPQFVHRAFEFGDRYAASASNR
jgi:hypothetical protein